MIWSVFGTGTSDGLELVLEAEVAVASTGQVEAAAPVAASMVTCGQVELWKCHLGVILDAVMFCAVGEGISHVTTVSLGIIPCQLSSGKLEN